MYRFRFLLLLIRFDDKAARTECRLEDKMAAFRGMRDIFMGLCKSLCLVVSAVCVDEQLLPFRGRCGFRQYRMSQEERTKLREGVPYVKVYRYNPKHLYPKLNSYGDNGKRSLKL